MIDNSILDLIDISITINLADSLFSQINSNDKNTSIILGKDNNIIVKEGNKTFTTKIAPKDMSTEGLIPIEKVEKIKSQISQVSNLLVVSSSNKNITNIIYSSKHFTIQIFNGTESFEVKNKNSNKKRNKNRRLLQDSGLSKIENDKCAIELKNYYKFEKDVLIGKIDFDPKLTSKRNFGDVSLKYYNPYNGTELPDDVICKDRSITIKHPLRDVPIDINEYQKYSNLSFNIYDKNSEFYSSRCKPLKNDSSSGDITLNQRRKEVYKNLSLSCGKCLFVDIDDNDSTVCKCLNVTDGKAFIENVIFDTASDYNIEIIICYHHLNYVK